MRASWYFEKYKRIPWKYKLLFSMLWWKYTSAISPNSGDMNPTETVWARLRFDLATREREDLKAGRTLSNKQFKQRVSQILQSYSMRSEGDRWNYYERLLRGMPGRFAKCRRNKFGPCWKWCTRWSAERRFYARAECRTFDLTFWTSLGVSVRVVKFKSKCQWAGSNSILPYRGF